MNKHKTILHLCADIGSDSKPYRDSGYNVIQIGEKEDVRKCLPSLPKEVYGIIANPPCTHFSFCRLGAHTPRNLYQSTELVNACFKIIQYYQYGIKSHAQKVPPLKFWVLENPFKAMTKWFLGKPPHVFHPWQYGDMWFKETALWGYFNMPEQTNFLKPENPKLLKMSISELRKFHHVEDKEYSLQDLRSIGPANFWKAFFEANQ
jgi:hypothetical protein